MTAALWSDGRSVASPATGAMPLVVGQSESRQRANAAAQGDQMVTALKPEDTTSAPESLYLDHLRARVVRITPERAATMLATLAFDRQRNIAPKHVEYLLAMMQNGELTDLLIQEAEFPNGRKVLVDGYHRLNALVQYGKSLLGVIVTYRVNDEQDLAERYAKIDRPATRKPKDMLRAFGVEDRAEMSSKMLSAISAGVVLVANGFPRHSSGPGGKSLIQRTHAVEEWLSEAQAYAACLSGSTNEIALLLQRGPVVAVALATLRYQTGAAETFWSRIAADDGLLRDSPEGRLLSWLRANRVARVGQFMYCRYVAGAWNAYYENRSLKLLKVTDPSAPVFISGTPLGKA